MKSSLLCMGVSLALASATLAGQPALWQHQKPHHNIQREIFTNGSTTAQSTTTSSASSTSTLPFTPITFTASNSSSSISGASSLSLTTTSTTPTATVSPTPQIEIFVIIIIINIDINLTKDKRQAVNADNSAEYILPNGGTTSSCNLAAQWYIQDGQLFSLAGGQVGTSPGVDSELFTASEDPGSITTTFTNGGELAWNNDEFTDGTAFFCRESDEEGSISILFTGPPPPGSVGCTQVSLGITTCPGGSNTVNNTIINNTINNIDNSVTNNIINNYNSYDVYEILPNSIIDSFNTGAINYYCGDDTYYYAKMCPVCPIVQVYKSNDTYAEPVCSSCPAEVMHCPGVTHTSTTPSLAHLSGSNHSASAGVCEYEAPICVSCENKSVVTPPSATTITVPCPTCPSSVTTLSCPASVASSVESVASAKGPAAAQSAASAANAITVTASGQSAAASTAVNVVCTTCPAGSHATVVAQVAATGNAAPASETGSSSPASPNAPSGNSAPSNEGGSSPAANASNSPESFTGSANALQISKLVAMIVLLLPVAML